MSFYLLVFEMTSKYFHSLAKFLWKTIYFAVGNVSSEFIAELVQFDVSSSFVSGCGFWDRIRVLQFVLSILFK